MKTIKMIAKEQGKPLGKMLEDCGLSKNALSSMSSGYLPRTENLVKIADYLCPYHLSQNSSFLRKLSHFASIKTQIIYDFAFYRLNILCIIC